MKEYAKKAKKLLRNSNIGTMDGKNTVESWIETYEHHFKKYQKQKEDISLQENAKKMKKLLKSLDIKTLDGKNTASSWIET